LFLLYKTRQHDDAQIVHDHPLVLDDFKFAGDVGIISTTTTFFLFFALFFFFFFIKDEFYEKNDVRRREMEAFLLQESWSREQ